MAAILGYGRYAPGRRTADEDALTMMLAAARPALAGHARPGRLALASMSLPYARRVQAGLVATALDLPAGTFCLECTTSARAATEAMRALGHGLVLAADGACAAAVLLGEGEAAPARIVAAQSAVAEYPGLDFTPAGELAVRDIQVTDYAESAYLDLVRTAAAGLRADVLALNAPHARLSRLAAGALGFGQAVLAPEGAGAAGPLLALFAALEQVPPGGSVLLVSYGSGSAADALLVEKRGHGGPGPAAAVPDSRKGDL